MVAVTAKPESVRGAVATSTVMLCPAAFVAVRDRSGPKGDAIQVSRIAAISAAKHTSMLIPLCHPVRITAVEISAELNELANSVQFIVQVTAFDRTGVEMEALTAASIAALTLYDMTKAIDKGAVIAQTKLVRKWGGRSGDFVAP